VRKARLLSSPWPLFLAGLSAACGPGPASRPPAPPARGAEILPLAGPLGPSRWVPGGVEGGAVIESLADGTQRVLLHRLRVEASPDGTVRRSAELLPTNALALGLPERLGGGFVFVAPSPGTQLWKSHDFLGRLEPLARLGRSPLQALAGPDRLLLRTPGGDRVLGLDLRTGALVAPSPLPAAPRLGFLTFADASRGVAFADLLGLVGTVDAGATWRPLGVSTPPKSVAAEGDHFVVEATNERYVVDARGQVAREDLPPARPNASAAPEGRPRPPPGPFGASPLRAALEEGWPLRDGNAVVARGGRVGLVRLSDGGTVALSTERVDGEDDAHCQALRLGPGIGFACGAPGRGTSIYALAQPLGLRPVAAFTRPRAVAPSGNGALVVRGPCDPEGDPARESPQGGRAYCVFGARGGAPWQFTTRGDVGVERVVALADGRVIVLVPPRGGDPGRVVTLQPGAAARPERPGGVVLRLPQAEGTKALLQRGLWLEGLWEAAPGEIAGWVEAGGTVVGVRVRVADGTLTAGKPREGADAVLSGPYALGALEGERLWETTDGGQSWHGVDLPPALRSRSLRGRACGPAGCTLSFERETWLRVGWGDMAPGDLEEARPPPAVAEPSPPAAAPLRCEIERALPPAHGTPAPSPTPRVPRLRHIGSAIAAERESGPWVPFRGLAPPALPAGYAGFDAGPGVGAPAYRLYAWAPKGVNFAQSARLLGRFYDRYDATGEVRSTALGLPPWSDENAISDALGFAGTPVVFHALPDPSGRATLASLCRSSRCELFGLAAGRPVERLPEADDAPYARLIPPSASAVLADDAWFVALGEPNQITVWRIEPSRSRVLARLPRLPPNGAPELVTLVRRARGGGIGLFSQGLGTVGRSERDLYVVPLDPHTGTPGEALRLGPADFGGKVPPPCDAEADGWLVDVTPAQGPNLLTPVNARVTELSWRLRLEPGRTCAEAATGRVTDLNVPKLAPATPPAKRPSKAALAQPGASLPIVVEDKGGRRALIKCPPATLSGPPRPNLPRPPCSLGLTYRRPFCSLGLTYRGTPCALADPSRGGNGRRHRVSSAMVERSMVDTKAFGDASERVAHRFTRAMNAATSPLGVMTDIPFAAVLCSLPLVAGTRRALSAGRLDAGSLAWFALAGLPLLALVAVDVWLRGRARGQVVRWLSQQPFPIDNINGLLAGVGDSFEVVFAPRDRRRAPGRDELQPKLDEVSDDALLLAWPDPAPDGEEVAPDGPDEPLRTVVIGLGIVALKHFPFRTAYLRYRRFQALVERVLVPLHGKRRLEGVRVR
jgi:hypothetical protein